MCISLLQQADRCNPWMCYQRFLLLSILSVTVSQSLSSLPTLSVVVHPVPNCQAHWTRFNPVAVRWMTDTDQSPGSSGAWLKGNGFLSWTPLSSSPTKMLKDTFIVDAECINLTNNWSHSNNLNDFLIINPIQKFPRCTVKNSLSHNSMLGSVFGSIQGVAQSLCPCICPWNFYFSITTVIPKSFGKQCVHILVSYQRKESGMKETGWKLSSCPHKWD